MTTTLETQATEAVTNEPTQYAVPEGWTFPSYDPVGRECEGVHTVYINQVRTGNRDAWIGTFRFAEAGRGNDGWSHNGRRVYGAVVNPVLYNGRHYLVFGQYVVRYNDEYHSSDRHHTSRPFSIVAGPTGDAWFFPNDGVASLEGMDYIAVNWLAIAADWASKLGQSEGEPAEPAGPALWEDGASTITFGKARTEEDGTVLLNPDPVIGDMYLCWDENLEAERTNHVSYTAVYVGGGGMEVAFVPSGFFIHYYGSAEYQNSASFGTVPTKWVKMGFRTDYTEPYNTRTRGFENELVASKNEFKNFNDACNRLALRHSWCGTYESIVKPLGMKSRYHGFWYAEVRAKTCVTRDSVTGYTARDFLSGLGVSGSEIANLSMEATVTFQVKAIEADTEEAAKELIDEERITASLARNYPDTAFSALTDIEVIAVYEDRDAAYEALNRRRAEGNTEEF